MAAAQIGAAIVAGHPGAQSALLFLTGTGMTCPASRSLAFLLHKFVADVGDLQSMMASVWGILRQGRRSTGTCAAVDNQMREMIPRGPLI
jgi:SEL1 protein